MQQDRTHLFRDVLFCKLDEDIVVFIVMKTMHCLLKSSIHLRVGQKDICPSGNTETSQ